jgi:hypothetical protein
VRRALGPERKPREQLSVSESLQRAGMGGTRETIAGEDHGCVGRQSSRVGRDGSAAVRKGRVGQRIAASAVREEVPAHGSGGFTSLSDHQLVEQLTGWTQKDGVPR